ncbi:MAG: ABC transporter ATP-binding protein [Actinomycetota bacterium]
MSAVPQQRDEATPALELRELDVAYRVRGIDRRVLRGVSLEVGRGESYGLVGESGCGKTTAAFAAMRYLPSNGRITAGSVLLDGDDLWRMSDDQVRERRANAVSMVYQNPGSALNPSMRVGRQVAEVFEISGASSDEANERTLEMLRTVQIADPDRVMQRYPHQLSGGMQQRVVIAMALASQPELLILDEPTTGLDATVEAEVLDLIAELRDRFGTSVLFISHNLAVISKMCDRVGVLYAGRLVEEGPARVVFDDPRHPYTVGLLHSIPRGGVRKDRARLSTIPGFLPPLGAEIDGCVFADRCGLADDRCHREEPALIPLGAGHASRCHYHDRAQTLPVSSAPVEASGGAVLPSDPARSVLSLTDISKTFHQEGHPVEALRDVSMDVRSGETLGLVGESGSGKTTLARILLGLTAPDTGSSVQLDGAPLAPLVTQRSSAQVRAVQIVFQNPDTALNRRFSVRRIIGRAVTKLLHTSGTERDERILHLAREVRFDERLIDVRPGQLSGGLKQRVAIARAFAGEPRLVVCDEPTSALDVSVQAAILNLLADMQSIEGVTYVFISHDLGVVRYLADRIAVLYLGRLMEVGDADRVFEGPHHPYTESLLSAVPTFGEGERTRIRLEGEIPSAVSPPSGCVFHTRCPRKIGDICEQQEPPLSEPEPGHLMRCHIPIDELRSMQRTTSVGSDGP